MAAIWLQEAVDTPAPLTPGSNTLSLDELLSTAEGFSTEWQAITLTVPQGDQSTVSAQVDRGNGRRPQLRETLTIDRSNGEILNVAGFETLPINQKVRSVYRFLHTGEYLGIIGQTVAGLVSFFGIIMVWTGLALAYRRLLQPLFNRRKPVILTRAETEAA